jgi:hypothetical protein
MCQFVRMKVALAKAAAKIKTVVARLDRAIKYSAASRFYRWRLWNTGSPGQSRAMTAVFVSFIRVGSKAGTNLQ